VAPPDTSVVRVSAAGLQLLPDVRASHISPISVCTSRESEDGRRGDLLLGKSLSGLFTVYSLLARPTAFNAYVGCSAGWFAENNDYFLELSTRAFRTVELFANRRVFMANSLQDQYDPDQAIHRQMIGFSELIKRNVRETMSYRYETYENYPHVPFPCLYDGLRFVTRGQSKK
jgi:predicted alpha/beta superfamily hydrolase